jgi:hypothetical protein
MDIGIIAISYFFALSSLFTAWVEHPEAFNDVLQAFLFGQMGMLFYFVAFRRREYGLEREEPTLEDKAALAEDADDAGLNSLEEYSDEDDAALSTST